MHSSICGIWNHGGKIMVIYFLVITDVGTHCCSSLIVQRRNMILNGKVPRNQFGIEKVLYQQEGNKCWIGTTTKGEQWLKSQTICKARQGMLVTK